MKIWRASRGSIEVHYRDHRRNGRMRVYVTQATLSQADIKLSMSCSPNSLKGLI